MNRRKHVIRSAPPVQEYPTKQELSERKSYPPCPTLPAKINRRKFLQKRLFEDPELSSARAVSYSRPVTLSPLYTPQTEQTYFDQVFTKDGVIGEGSFGIVFKVQSREDSQQYAVKQFKASHNFHYSYAEVENYEKIGEHRNFVKFIMAWEQMKVVHIQMEYCSLSLAQYAAFIQKLSQMQLWEILYDMAQALDHLHCKNLIHLDIKPGNIMMSQGFYKLADFGLLVDLNKHDRKKVSTISDGDARYLACEVLDGIYTYSCDIFGLGISLLELATNIELPEFGPLWHQIREPCLPSTFHQEVTKSFSRTVERMMSASHWERPTASEMLRNTHLKDVQRQDAKKPRYNYSLDLPEQICTLVIPENNNIIETPRRPLFDVHNTLGKKNSSDASHSSKSGPSSVKTNHISLPRVKLLF